jgi:hypothetical protein
MADVKKLLVTNNLRDVASTNYDLLMVHLGEQLTGARSLTERDHVGATLESLRSNPALADLFKQCLVFLDGVLLTGKEPLEEVLKALQRLVDRPERHDVLAFFYRNPDVVDNLAGISIWSGHSEQAVEEILESLVTTGVIQKHGHGPEAVYTYANDVEVLKAVDDFMRRGTRDAGRGTRDAGR